MPNSMVLTLPSNADRHSAIKKLLANKELDKRTLSQACSIKSIISNPISLQSTLILFFQLHLDLQVFSSFEFIRSLFCYAFLNSPMESLLISSIPIYLINLPKLREENKL
jgi:hypothetical protein